jgi:hypothetical protein
MSLFSRNSKRLEAESSAKTKASFDALGREALHGVIQISGVKWRENVRVAGRVKALRVQPWADQVASLELTLADETGGITVVFFGRRTLGGVNLGTHLVVEGMTSEHHRLLTILNPAYQLLPRQVTLPY